MLKKIGKKKMGVIIGIASLLGLLIIAVTGFIFVDRKQNEFRTIHSPEKAEAEAKNLVAKVSQIYILPLEIPTVATVTDKSKLSDQVFFANAKEGDKVLIFSQNKKVVLYRESTNKIIDVAPLNMPSPADLPIASSSSTLNSSPQSVISPKQLYRSE